VTEKQKSSEESYFAKAGAFPGAEKSQCGQSTAGFYFILSYDAIFDGETLGIEFFKYDAKTNVVNVVRVSNIRPIGVPFFGDQVCHLVKTF